MVSGAPTVGAPETRRRLRYAALSGLAQAGFLPTDPEHIGYVKPAQDRGPSVVPFEWLEMPSDSGGSRALLLLWLDDASFSEAVPPLSPQPLQQLSAFLGEVRASIEKVVTKEAVIKYGGLQLQTKFRLIGPAHSGTLLDMAREHRRPPDRTTDKTAKTDGCPVAPIYSPFATVPPAEVLWNAESSVVYGKGRACVGVEVPAPNALNGALRTIVSDDRLVALLHEELQRRHVRPPARVALVGEWDTSYTRALVKGFREALGPKAVLSFNYMRGLDGRIPDDDSAQKDESEHALNRGASEGKGAGRMIERPVGDAQIDYLRRMRGLLLERDAVLRRDCSLLERRDQRCGIRAIGVIGNDYHDKLLVLQALQPVFPYAVFFTTDLEAAMLHPVDNRFTRNLIVASGFGLRVIDTGSKVGIPPMRWSYQTSLMAAVRHAVHAVDRRPVESLPPRERLFEVGRTRFVELATVHAGPLLSPGVVLFACVSLSLLTALAITARWLMPDVSARPAALKVLLVASLVLLVLARTEPLQTPGGSESSWSLLTAVAFASTLALAFKMARVWSRRRGIPFWCSGKRRLRTCGRVLGMVAAVGALMILDASTGGEPFSWLEGVSVWPSELLRGLAGVLGLYLLSRGHVRQRRYRKWIRKRFLAHGPGSAAKPGAKPGPCIDLLVQVQEEVEPLPDSGDDIRVQHIWRDYNVAFDIKRISERIWPEIVLFLGFAFSLMVALGFPNRPVRSDLAWHLDLAIVLSVVVVLLVLLFYLVDATRQTLALARRLAGRVCWPAAVLERFGLSPWASPCERPDHRMDGDIAWLDVKLIAHATEPVGNLVWYPVWVLILLAFSRAPYFDAWALPPALAAVMSLVILYSVMCALQLRKEAERVRTSALADLRTALLRAQGDAGKSICVEQLKTMIAEIREEQGGAFRPFGEQPLVRAGLMLLSSLSGLALMDYFVLFDL
jgi:hypothetical protein